MALLFGYMDSQIILKWLTDFKGNEGQAPSIITNMIDMVLHGGVVPDTVLPIVGGSRSS